MLSMSYSKFLAILIITFIANNSYAKVFCYREKIFDIKDFSLNNEFVEVTADESSILSKNLYLLKGNTSILGSDYALSSDNATLDKSKSIITANNNVQFQDKNFLIETEKLIYKKNSNGIDELKTDQALFQIPSNNIRGKASSIFGTTQVPKLNNATYTKCPLGNNSWSIKADQITLNKETNRGLASDTTLNFFDIPIFYTPSHSWVLSGRGSGFLTPGFGRYTDSASPDERDLLGTGYKTAKHFYTEIPYYFNIAPDRDLLLTHRYLTTRGNVINAHYRQLISDNEIINNGKYEIKTSYAPKDKVTNQDRWLAETSLDLSLLNNTDIAIQTNRASDKDFLNEISLEGTSESKLNSSIAIDHQIEEKGLRLSLFHEKEQLMNSGSASYTREPEVTFSKDFFSNESLDINLSLVSTKFKHDDSSQTTGSRHHLKSSLKKKLGNLAYSFSPELDLYETKYSLDQEKNFNRSLYRLHFDSELFLERELALNNKYLIQTLTPRISYNYIPTKDQSLLPSFDSANSSHSYNSLFGGLKYTGIDRISNDNSFTLGAESSFLDEENGDTFVTLNAAQKLYITNETLNDQGLLVPSRRQSDIYASIGFEFGKLNFSNSIEIEPEKLQNISKSQTKVSYIDSPKKFLDFAIINEKDNENVSLNATYPVNNNLHFFLGLNHSLTSKQTTKNIFGIGYESCCLGFRVAHFKTQKSSRNWDHVTKFELVFKGLASSSPSLRKDLENSIPNYLVDLNEI